MPKMRFCHEVPKRSGLWQKVERAFPKLGPVGSPAPRLFEAGPRWRASESKHVCHGHLERDSSTERNVAGQRRRSRIPRERRYGAHG